MHRTALKYLLIAASSFICVAVRAQEIPKQIQPPPGEQFVLRVHGKGEQVYACKEDVSGYIWVLNGPDAQLTDESGKAFGRHFIGPSWQAKDGSKVVGQAVANSPSPEADSLPWLLINVTSHEGTGVLSRVTHIQRINTKGGKAPASPCDESHSAQEVRVPYSADYLFYAPK